jgi:hypothetical protein
MERVRAQFDGEKVILLEPVQYTTPVEVVVVFPDEPIAMVSEPEITGRTIAALMEENDSFDFLNDPEEDIYSDEDLKVKYK